MAYGGGGPLHSAEIARELGIPKVLIPPQPGNFSALGMLAADIQRDLARTFLQPLTEQSVAEAGANLLEMQETLSASMRVEFGIVSARFEYRAELRYRGQMHTLRIPLDTIMVTRDIKLRFDEAYGRRFGHADPAAPAEFVALSVTARAEIAGRTRETRPDDAAPTPAAFEGRAYFEGYGEVAVTIYERSSLSAGFAASGPALLREYGSTTVVGPLDRFTVGYQGEILIELGKAVDEN
jgi:N-methylhydantoinase A